MARRQSSTIEEKSELLEVVLEWIPNMSKKKQSANRKPAKPIERPLSNRLIDGLNEVESLTQRKR